MKQIFLLVPVVSPTLLSLLYKMTYSLWVYLKPPYKGMTHKKERGPILSYLVEEPSRKLEICKKYVYYVYVCKKYIYLLADSV